MPITTTAVSRPRKSITPPEPAPAPGLKRLGVVKTSDVEVAKSKAKLGLVPLAGDTVRRFNEAKAAITLALSTVEELEPDIRKAALGAIFASNCSPATLEAVTSVKVQDQEENEETGEIEPGAICRVSFTKRYNNCDAAQVDAAFSAFEPIQKEGRLIRRDINDYVVETIGAKFDDSIWTNPDGSFNQKVYDKFRLACEKVALELGLTDEDGKARSPLHTHRKVSVKPSFHERRFTDFSQEENLILTEVLPNTVQFVPQNS